MKKNNGLRTVLITPGASGWLYQQPDGLLQHAETLEQVGTAIPSNTKVHLALPCRTALMERMKLPATDREELMGMIQLQVEKTLPYPVEEASVDFVPLQKEESETTLLSVVANHRHLDTLCEPLRAKGRLPDKISIAAQHVAAHCEAGGIVLNIWFELGETVVGIAEKGSLGYATIIPTTDTATVLLELPMLLLNASLDGVPTEFTRVRVETAAADLIPGLKLHLNRSVEIFDFKPATDDLALNLVPEPWHAEVRRQENAGRFRQRLQTAVLCWLVLLVGVLVFLVVLNKKLRSVENEIAQIAPTLQMAQTQKQRWDLMAPAVQPKRFAVEILRIAQLSRPSTEVSITKFDYNIKGFTIEGEAANTTLWDGYVQKLQSDPALSIFKLEAGPPELLPNDHAKFKISGKLK